MVDSGALPIRRLFVLDNACPAHGGRSGSIFVATHDSFDDLLEALAQRQNIMPEDCELWVRAPSTPASFFVASELSQVRDNDTVYVSYAPMLPLPAEASQALKQMRFAAAAEDDAEQDSSRLRASSACSFAASEEDGAGTERAFLPISPLRPAPVEVRCSAAEAADDAGAAAHSSEGIMMPGSAIARAVVAVLSKGEEQEAVDKGSSALHAPVATEIGHDDDDADLILPLNARPPVAPDPAAPQGHGPHPHTLTRPMTRPQAPVRPPLVSIPLLNLAALATHCPHQPTVCRAPPTARRMWTPDPRPLELPSLPSSLGSPNPRDARGACDGQARRAAHAGSHAPASDRKEGPPSLAKPTPRESPRKTPRPPVTVITPRCRLASAVM